MFAALQIVEMDTCATGGIVRLRGAHKSRLIDWKLQHEFRRSEGVSWQHFGRGGGIRIRLDTVLSRSAVLLSEMTLPAPDVVQDYLDSIEGCRLDCVFAHAQRTDLLRFLRAA